MRTAIWIAIPLLAVSLRGGWDPRLAAEYLDARQQEWFAWPVAKAVTGGTCFSCHTGATYLLARPALRRVLGESRPTAAEKELLDGLRARAGVLDAKRIKSGFAAEPMASQALGVESVFAALFLSLADSGGAFDADAQKAFDRLWSLQVNQGPARGAWPWFNLDLDPYEMPPSPFFGAALAAYGIGSTPAGYRKQAKVQARVGELNAYFARERESQPLHNRLMLLWASTKLPAALPEAARRSTIDEVWRKQEADGGWTIDSLGPWAAHREAEARKGSDSYATALVVCALEAANVLDDPRLGRAVAWLEAHQDRQKGYWDAVSMNKRYEPGSMQAQFMRDAATAFAALALSQSRLKAD